MDGGRFFTYEKTFVAPVHLVRKETALLVIDMQYHDASADQGMNLAYDRLNPGCMDYFNKRNEELVIPTIRTLLNDSRAKGMRVIYLTVGSQYRDLRDMPERTRALIRSIEAESGVPDMFWAGNPAFAIREEIKPMPDETVINKVTWGAFNSSYIDLALRSMGVKSLVITGISTNSCVETTSRDAADRGYGCVIVDEATADYDVEAHDAALRGFFFNFGRIVKSADDVIHALDSEASV